MTHRTNRFLPLVLSVMLILLAVTPSFGCVFADEEVNYCYADGINLPCGLNGAVVYRDIASTGQSRWVHNVIVDSNGVITRIIEGGSADSADVSVPEGGMVIAASGTKVQWFKDHASAGDSVWLDTMTSRLFVYSDESEFDPYYTLAVTVTGEGEYIISSSEFEGIPQYGYTVYVDSIGVVVPEEVEGGFSVTAGTDGDKALLTMYAPLGAVCSVDEDVIKLTYSASSLKKSVELTLSEIKAEYEALKAECAYIDYAAIDALIAEYEAAEVPNDYRSASELCHGIRQIRRHFAETVEGELRGALHTPDEKNDAEVYATVKAAADAGLNTVSLRLTNGYGTFLPLPDSFEYEQAEEFDGFDVLSSYVKYCDQLGVSLDVCVDVYYNEYASVTNPSMLTEVSGKEEGVRAKFFSPANDEFKEYFISYIDFLISNYSIDSLTLDYIRYPKFSEDCDYGYDSTTLAKFCEEYGVSSSAAAKIKNELYMSEHWNDWVDFRQGLISGMVKSISDTVREKRSDIYINAYVSRDVVDYFYMQDSKTWLENGWVDGLNLALFDYDAKENDSLTPIAYGDGLVLDKSALFSAYTSSNNYFFVTLGTVEGITHEMMLEYVFESRECADGFMFGNLEAFIGYGYASHLGEVLKGSCLSPIMDEEEAVRALIDFSLNKLEAFMLPSGFCDESTAQSIMDTIDEFLLSIYISGIANVDATGLMNTVSMYLAASPAKNEFTQEYERIAKIVLLAKDEAEFTPVPNPDESTPDVNPETSTDVDISTPEASTGENSSHGVSTDIDESIPDGFDSAQAGKVIVYVFVGFSLIAGITGFIAYLRKRK